MYITECKYMLITRNTYMFVDWLRREIYAGNYPRLARMEVFNRGHKPIQSLQPSLGRRHGNLCASVTPPTRSENQGKATIGVNFRHRININSKSSTVLRGL